ncbi:MAG: hypothetical protein IJK64_06105 [Clostridia bacterium]|nr:hypothetical protein [Clostridia bacterium]
MESQPVLYRANTMQSETGPRYGVEAVLCEGGAETVLHAYDDVFDSPQEAAAFATQLNENCVELCHLVEILEDLLG